MPTESSLSASPQGSPLEVLTVFFKLGLQSFGGPIAHFFSLLALLRDRTLIDIHRSAGGPLCA